MRLHCPAKVNLYLRVLGRRTDGYHELVTVMQPLSLGDQLTVTPGGDSLSFTCDHPEAPQGTTTIFNGPAAARERADLIQDHSCARHVSVGP